ncbi:MAG: LytR C-terminal domain-containing protein [Acidimicrobiales bacterium]
MSDASHPHHQASVGGSHYQPALGVVFIILVLFVGATYLMLRSTNSTPSSVGTTTTTTLASTGGGSTSTTLPKNKVPVQVANGTNVSGLARTYTQQLEALNWDALPQVNGPKVTSTVIYYNPGFLWAAQEIASEIKVSTSAIQPLNGLNPVSGASGDDVIVILGPDVAIKN